MAAFASLAALAALGAPMAASGCGDGAFDAGFHGEPIGRLDGAVLMISLGVAFPENEKWRTGASIVWGGPDGQTASDDRVALALDPERRFHLTLYGEPPAGVVRAAERGSIALGQVIFWSPSAPTDGATRTTRSSGARRCWSAGAPPAQAAGSCAATSARAARAAAERPARSSRSPSSRSAPTRWWW
ncbi:MAG: hypothetical protein U1F43_38970 [Myxococcota bacterium]